MTVFVWFRNIAAMLLCIGVAYVGCGRSGQQAAEQRHRTSAATIPVGGVAALRDIQKADNREFLLRYLSSDVRWRVTFDGAVVADRRRVVGGDSICPDNTAQIDIRVRFEPYQHTPRWLATALKNNTAAVIKLQDAPTTVQLPLWTAKDSSGHIGSCLVVSGDGIWIEIKEWSNYADRRCTQQALRYLASELPRILMLPRGHDDAAYWRQVLPSGTVGGKQESVVNEGIGGQRTVTGFLNAGQPGYVRVVVIDLATRREIPMERSGAVEYVGWSNDKSVFFPFSIDVWVNEATPLKPLRFEIRFNPSSAEKVIMECNVPEGAGKSEGSR